MRNILTHEYVAVDLALVSRAIPLTRSGYGEYVAAVARYLISR